VTYVCAAIIFGQHSVLSSPAPKANCCHRKIKLHPQTCKHLVTWTAYGCQAENWLVLEAAWYSAFGNNPEMDSVFQIEAPGNSTAVGVQAVGSPQTYRHRFPRLLSARDIQQNRRLSPRRHH